MRLLAIVAPSVAIVFIGIGAIKTDEARINAEQKAFALEQKIAHQNTMGRTEIAVLDSQINQAYDSIDRLKAGKEKRIDDSLANNQNRNERIQIQQRLAYLNRQNLKHIKCAYEAAIANHPYYDVAKIPCTEQVFYIFFHDDTVKREHRKYSNNNREAEKLRERLAKIPSTFNLPRDIRLHFDNQTNQQTKKQLEIIEELLRKKDSVIAEKIR